MNKSTNNFRRCEFCPHHENKKSCCCQQTRQSVHSVKTKANSRNKNKMSKKNTHDNSTLTYINTTLPITNTSVNPHLSLSNNILAENSILRTENDYLKRQLHSQICNVSAFMKDDRNISTLPTSENDTSRTYHLHDKLYASNRNLQEALIQLDSLSKTNKQLHQINTKLELEKQQLRISNEEVSEQSQKLKKKIKKLNKLIENLPNQSDFQEIIKVNSQLVRQNNSLREEVEELKEELKRKNSRSRTIVEIQNLSPEWVAHTSTKINALEKNISKLEQQKENNSMNHNSSYLASFLYSEKQQPQEDLSNTRQQLMTTIKLLKIQSQSNKLGSYTFNEMVGNNPTMLFLIKTLCESLMEPIESMYRQLQKEMERVLKSYENRFEKVVRRMQNMVMKVQNERLRGNSSGRHF